jgi:hypothetical protein
MRITLAAQRARGIDKTSAPKKGVGNAGCPVHPQPRVRSGSLECTRVFTAVAPEITRHPRTQWFYGLCRTLPGDRAFLSPSLAKIASRKLDAGVEASGPHDFAVRKQNAFVRSAACGHRIQPRVRDDRDTPLKWGGRGGDKVICDFGKPEYFFGWDWTGRNSLIRLRKLDFTRKSAGRAGGQQLGSSQPAGAPRRQDMRHGVCELATGQLSALSP